MHLSSLFKGMDGALPPLLRPSFNCSVVCFPINSKLANNDYFSCSSPEEDSTDASHPGADICFFLHCDVVERFSPK